MDLTSTAELLGNLGEFFGAIAVVFSLLFVGYSIVQNTKATRAQTHQAITQSFMAIAEIIAVRPEVFAAGMGSESKDFEELSVGDKAYFIATIFGLFKYYELMFMQHRNGNTDDESWEAWSKHIVMQFQAPGVRTWWSLRETAFHPAFRKFLNESGPSTMTSFVELVRS